MYVLYNIIFAPIALKAVGFKVAEATGLDVVHDIPAVAALRPRPPGSTPPGRGAPGLWSVPREGNIIKYDHMYNIAMLHNICVYISVAWVGDGSVLCRILRFGGRRIAACSANEPSLAHLDLGHRLQKCIS